MTNPTSLIDGLRNNAAAAGSAEANPMPAPAREVGPATTRISGQANGGGATILRHPAAPEPTPPAQYLDTAFDLDNARIPFVRFRGIRHVLPDHEGYVVGWRSLVREIAPDPAPVIGNRDAVPYFIAGTLKDAELINEKLRQARLANGESTIGRQRSSAHIASLGPAILLDDDGDVFAREGALRVLGVACAMYSSFSFGFTKGDATRPGRCGRVVLFLNRTVTTTEYGPLWDAINHLLGGGFDEHGRSPALCYGRHARRSADAVYKRLVVEGAALDADALIELGRSLRPERMAGAAAKDSSESRRILVEEIERAHLLGAVHPPNSYGDWVAGLAAMKRAMPNDAEGAFRCADAWSACSLKYRGTDDVRRKFDQVPAEYDGPAVPVTMGMLHWRARRRVEGVIAALFPIKWTAACPPGKPPNRRESDPEGNDPEPISSDSFTAEDGVAALDYLGFCWSNRVLQDVLAFYTIPTDVLDEAKRRGEARRERIGLADRTLHRWGGKDLAEDTRALSAAIINAGAKLYRVDNILVRISPPVSDQTTATLVRKLHRYTGQPGAPGDPALHAGERVVPLLPSDLEALREIIANRIATKRRVNFGTKSAPDWREEITSFSFKSTARIYEEPDAGVLKDLLKRCLVAQVPEIRGVITAPVMPDLPRSTQDVAEGADRIIAQPGLDAASGLYLSPLGTMVEVPITPSRTPGERVGGPTP